MPKILKFDEAARRSLEAGEEVPDDLTKADASKKIDELQDKSDRLS